MLDIERQAMRLVCAWLGAFMPAWLGAVLWWWR